MPSTGCKIPTKLAEGEDMGRGGKRSTVLVGCGLGAVIVLSST